MTTLARIWQTFLRGPDKTTVEGCRANVYLCLATLASTLLFAALFHDGWSPLLLGVGVWAAVDATRFYRKAKHISAGQSTNATAE